MKFGVSRLSSVSVMAAPKRFCNFDFFAFAFRLTYQVFLELMHPKKSCLQDF